MFWRKRLPTGCDQHRVRLPSSQPGLAFTADFQVTWTLLGPLKRQQQPSAAAFALVLDAANAVLSEHPATVLEAQVVEHRINAALGRRLQIHPLEIRIDSARVCVTVDPDTAHAAGAYAQRIRDEYIADIILAAEVGRLEKFKEYVLGDPGSAIAYWFMNNPDHFTKSSGQALEEHLRRLEMVATKVAEYDPSQTWIQVAIALQEVANKLTQEQCNDLVSTLARLARRYGSEDAAENLGSQVQ